MGQGWAYEKGLHDIGNGCYAYLQPLGGWGYSNAGLIVADDRSCLVDTLFDENLTREMLDLMRAKVPQSRLINSVVNTHAHPDHTAGNCLCGNCEFIASEATRDEILVMLNGEDPIQHVLDNWQNLGEAGEYMHKIMGAKFQLSGRKLVVPTTVFSEEMELEVGSKLIRLKKLGPAHSRGDTIVHLPQERVVYAGDLLFNEVHPAIVSVEIVNWLNACNYILSLDCDVIVPGHGPIADKAAVSRLRDYLVYFRDEARKRYDAGMPYDEAARDIALDAFRGWADEERIFITTANLYTSFGAPRPPMLEVMAHAGRYLKEQERATA